MGDTQVSVKPLNGFEALARLLDLRGRGIPRHQLLEICGPDPSPEAMARCLEYRDLQARAVKLDLTQAARLDVPTLLLVKGEGWLILHSVQGHLFDVEGAAQERASLPRGTLLETFDGLSFDLLPGLPEGTIWQRVVAVLLSQKKSFYPVFAIIGVSQLLGLVTPLLTGALVDEVFPQGARSLFIVVVAGSLIVGLFEAWLSWIQQKYLLYIETRLEAILERGLLNHLLRLPYGFLQSRTVGQLMQGFSGLSAAKDLVSSEVMGTLLGGCSVVIYLVVMLKLMPGATGFVAIVSLALGVASLFIAFYQAKIQRLQLATQASYQSFMVELLNGVPTVKAAGAEDRILDRWVHLLRRDRLVGLFSQRINQITGAGMGLVGQLQGLVLLMWGGKLVIAGQLKLGELLAFTMMAGTFQAAVQGFFGAFIRVWMMRPYLEISSDILDRKREPLVAPAIHKTLKAPLVVEDLWFRYAKESPWVVEGENFRVRPGEMHQIQGPSGSGKSTLLRLVAGLHAPEKGRIRLETGEPLPARSLCIYLPQFVQLLNGSVLDNLKLLSGGAPRARLLATAKSTGLADLVAELPMGLDTLVSSGGGNFSGGQRQLIALSGVLASDRPVLLLDEAMSNLDSLRRISLMKSDLFLNKTILFASHDGGLSMDSCEGIG